MMPQPGGAPPSDVRHTAATQQLTVGSDDFKPASINGKPGTLEEHDKTRIVTFKGPEVRTAGCCGVSWGRRGVVWS